ncbi:MAG: hypothetical protein SFV15_03380 [Polyangiaceae bacterium]|nr:hypothetical protein [Polyangiaceae bacterium]
MNAPSRASALENFRSDEGSLRTAWGTLIALVLHGTFLIFGMLSTAEAGKFAQSVLDHVKNRWALTYEIDEPPPLPEEKPEPEPPPPPEPTKPEPDVTPRPASSEAPPPPVAAEAAQVITQEPDPSAPLDLTAEGFVTGTAESYAGGYTTSKGSSKVAVSQKPSTVGLPGGTRPAASVAAPAVDLSKPATWATGDIMQRCGFPPEADAAQVDFARVVLTVSVSASGSITGVSILSETPAGLGFGTRAKSCANRTTFLPARDRLGKPIAGVAGPIKVNFTRAR